MADKVSVCVGMVFEFDGLTEKEARTAVVKWMREVMRDSIPAQCRHITAQYRLEEAFQQALVTRAQGGRSESNAHLREQYTERGEPIPDWVERLATESV